jgi:putative tricarboxylic transport membrane protein
VAAPPAERRRRWRDRPRALKDILAGLAFVGFGLAFAVSATAYEIGTTVRMGPGYFPLVLGGLLVLLGGFIAAKGFLASEEGAIGTIPWRALALIVGAVLFFGLTVRGLGLVPATFVTALMSAFASRRAGVVAALLVTVGLTVLCVLVFVVVLSLRLPLVGTWIRI